MTPLMATPDSEHWEYHQYLLDVVLGRAEWFEGEDRPYTVLVNDENQQEGAETADSLVEVAALDYRIMSDRLDAALFLNSIGLVPDERVNQRVREVIHAFQTLVAAMKAAGQEVTL